MFFIPAIESTLKLRHPSFQPARVNSPTPGALSSQATANKTTSSGSTSKSAHSAIVPSMDIESLWFGSFVVLYLSNSVLSLCACDCPVESLRICCEEIPTIASGSLKYASIASSAFPYFCMYLVASLMGRLVTAMNWLSAAVNSGEVVCRWDALEVRITLDCKNMGIGFSNVAHV